MLLIQSILCDANDHGPNYFNGPSYHLSLYHYLDLLINYFDYSILDLIIHIILIILLDLKYLFIFRKNHLNIKVHQAPQKY